MTLLLALLLNPAAQAADTYKIKQVLTSRHRVVVDGASDLKPGTELIATFKSGVQCTLKVTAVEGKVANADTSDCASAHQLVAGQTLERSLAIDENRAKPARTEPVKTQPTWTPRPPPRRALTDLQYMPQQSQMAFAGTFVYGQTKTSSTLNATKDKISSETLTSNAIRLEGIYGYTENLAFGLQVGYLVGAEAETSFGTGSTQNGQRQTVKSDGLQDPRLKMSYRLTEQDTVPAIIDVMVAYSPNTGKNKSATVNNRGSAFRGGDVFSVGIEAGNKSDSLSFVFGLDMDFQGPATAVNADTGVGTRQSAVSRYTIRAAGQVPVMEQGFLRAGLARIATGGYSQNSQGSEATVESGSQTELQIGFVKEWKPDTLAFQLQVAKRLEADYTGKIGTNTIDMTDEALAVALSALMTF